MNADLDIKEITRYLNENWSELTWKFDIFDSKISADTYIYLSKEGLELEIKKYSKGGSWPEIITWDVTSYMSPYSNEKTPLCFSIDFEDWEPAIEQCLIRSANILEVSLDKGITLYKKLVQSGI